MSYKPKTIEETLEGIRAFIEAHKGRTIDDGLIDTLVFQASNAYYEGWMGAADKTGEACRASMIRCMRGDDDYSNN